MAPQKRKKDDISASPDSKKVEPTSKKQTLGEGVGLEESTAFTNPSNSRNDKSASMQGTPSNYSFSSAQQSLNPASSVVDARATTHPSTSSNSSSAHKILSSTSTGTRRSYDVSGRPAGSNSTNYNGQARLPRASTSRRNSRSSASAFDPRAIVDTGPPRMVLELYTRTDALANSLTATALTSEARGSIAERGAQTGASAPVLSSPNMTPPSSREATPEAVIRAYDERRAQLLALRNTGIIARNISQLENDLGGQTMTAAGSADVLDAFQISGQKYSEERAREAEIRRQNQHAADYRSHGGMNMGMGMGMEIGGMNNMYGMAGIGMHSTSSMRPMASAIGGHPPIGQQHLGRSHHTPPQQHGSRAHRGRGRSHGRQQSSGRQTMNLANATPPLSGQSDRSDSRSAGAIELNTGDSDLRQNQRGKGNNVPQNKGIWAAGAQLSMGQQQDQRGRHHEQTVVRSEASRRQWEESRHAIPSAFFSEEDDLIISTNKAITMGENIANGAYATIQQVRDRVPFDGDGTSLHIKEVVKEQHAILETLLRMGRPLVDTTTEILEQNRLLRDMVISMKEREATWKKEKEEYQRELRNTVDWAPFDPLMADSNNFDDGGEANVPGEFTLSDDDDIMPVMAQWNTQRTGGAYTMKADYPYLRKFYPKQHGSPQPIPTDREIMEIIKPYEGNPKMTLAKIKRYYNDVRMKREYKIKELTNGGQWEKLAKDWGIGKEESPKIQVAPQGAYEFLRKELVRVSSTIAVPAATETQKSGSALRLSVTTTSSVPPTDSRSATGDGGEPERLVDYFSNGDTSDLTELEDDTLENELPASIPATRETLSSQIVADEAATDDVAAAGRSVTANSETESIVVSEKPKRKTRKST